MRICIFEDHSTEAFSPLTLTRPLFDLWSGSGPLDHRLLQYFAQEHTGYLVRPELAEVTAELRPGTMINDMLWLRSANTVLVNSRWIPPAGKNKFAFPKGPALGVVGNEVAYAILSPEQLRAVSLQSFNDQLADWFTCFALRDVGGRMIHTPTDLVDWNEQLIKDDFERDSSPEHVYSCPEGVYILGSWDRCRIAPTAQLEPWVVLDVRRGPIIIGEGASISAFTELRGPCVIGPRSQVHRGRIFAGTTLAVGCSSRGTVDNSIVLDGLRQDEASLLRSSYAGGWVELAHWTASSGATLADHSQLATGVQLHAGTTVGLFSRLVAEVPEKDRRISSFEEVLADGTRDILLPGACLKRAEALSNQPQSRLGKAQLKRYRSLLQSEWNPTTLIEPTMKGFRAVG